MRGGDSGQRSEKKCEKPSQSSALPRHYLDIISALPYKLSLYIR